MDAAYITSAKTTAQIRRWEHPEVAMLGRSNCGKSSLINALLNQRGIARVSASPGRTQMINYFSLALSAEQRLVLADLPGWGYNKAQKENSAKWEQLMTAYLRRKAIRDYCLLLDTRRSITEQEWEFFSDLASSANLIVILTKADKLKAQALRKAEGTLKEAFATQKIPVLSFCTVSSLKKSGIPQLRKLLFRN